MSVKQLSGRKVTEGGMGPKRKVMRRGGSNPVECEYSPILGYYAQEPVKTSPYCSWRLGVEGGSQSLTAGQDGEDGPTCSGR